MQLSKYRIFFVFCLLLIYVGEQVKGEEMLSEQTLVSPTEMRDDSVSPIPETKTFRKEVGEPLSTFDLSVLDSKYFDFTEAEVAVFSVPAVFPFFVRKFRHLIISVRYEDGTIVTTGLYPTDMLKAGLSVLTKAKVFDTDAEIRVNDVREMRIATAYFEKKPLPFDARYEARIIPRDRSTSTSKYVQKLMTAIANYPKERLRKGYHALDGPNSNTFVDDIIETSGGYLPVVQNAPEQKWGEFAAQ